MPNSRFEAARISKCVMCVGGNAAEAILLYRLLFWIKLSKTDWAYDSLKNWAIDTGIPASTYKKALSRLVSKGLVKKRIRYAPSSTTRTTYLAIGEQRRTGQRDLTHSLMPVRGSWLRRTVGSREEYLCPGPSLLRP